MLPGSISGIQRSHPAAKLICFLLLTKSMFHFATCLLIQVVLRLENFIKKVWREKRAAKESEPEPKSRAVDRGYVDTLQNTTCDRQGCERQTIPQIGHLTLDSCLGNTSSQYTLIS